ncbi:MAG: FAD-dependent oxidoreductase, partial [Pseudomonadota bacterium]
MVVTRRGAIASGLAAGLAGCAGQDIVSVSPSAGAEAAYGFADLAPLDLDPANLTKITVCLRPFRTSGPRLEVDRAGQRVLIHNYGHGGSGWSLAWGYAEAARDLVARSRPNAVTVIGAGAIGLTAAIAIAETGVRVTIAARDMPMESASAKATGVWSPSSRIGLVGAVTPQFAGQWEEFARRSYARHLRYVGRVGHPVEFTPRFYVRSGAPEPQLSVQPDGAASFLHIDRNLRGLTPPWNERERHPFPTEYGVRGGLVMTFNIAEYTRQLVEDFRAMGGRIERMNLNSREDFSSLPGDAIVNCSGLGAQTIGAQARRFVRRTAG